MAGRVQQDTFIDDSDETCPLCVEEFDLSDRNFRPCPCGYQVCQFCFNNIKNNMNGLCPACRRPYDEKSIEWKVVSPEEFKADVQKQARKKAEIRQKEAQKREVESQNRKHLSGLRVVQKNLVYVVGLNPRIREEDLLQTLRGEQYFGQYGKIVKIVVSKARDGGQGNQPLGVYVTFARVQDAERCIAAVDGSENGGRTLRAQFGTTKYCSAYLRNEQCMNKSCMFLHEAGEEKDSFTRQDLSSINVVSTQRPAQQSDATSAGEASSQAQSQHPPQRGQDAVTAATQPMGRLPSKDGTISPVDSGDGSALPTSASWGKQGQQQSRRASASASTSTPSPHIASASLPSQSRDTAKKEATAPDPIPEQADEKYESTPGSTIRSKGKGSAESLSVPLLNQLLKSISSPEFKFVFSTTMFSPEEYDAIVNHPALLDPDGGARRRAARASEHEELRADDDQAKKAAQASADVQQDEVPGSGSLQLGGEPEDGHEQGESGARADLLAATGQDQQQRAVQPPTSGASVPSFAFGQTHGPDALSSLLTQARSFTPSQQQQQQQLSSLKPGDPQSALQGLAPQNQHLQSGLFQNQTQQLAATGHARQSSRYTFANDSASASAAVKPAANAKLMAQQSAMMPGNQNQHPQQYGGQYATGAAHGPPPGLKSTGTPPTSGGGMFGQGHGFAGAMSTGPSVGRTSTTLDEKSELLRDMFRSRGGASGVGNGQAPDAAKREYMFPSFLQQYPTSTTPTPAPGLLGTLHGSQAGVWPDHGPQKQQKKKGKKHRHANTSSSGGGGIVNLADPSILQARMQPQASTAAGQGFFGGQGQVGEGLPRLGEESSSIDASAGEANSGPSHLTEKAAVGPESQEPPIGPPSGTSGNPTIQTEEAAPTLPRVKHVPDSAPIVPVIPAIPAFAIAPPLPVTKGSKGLGTAPRSKPATTEKDGGQSSKHGKPANKEIPAVADKQPITATVNSRRQPSGAGAPSVKGYAKESSTPPRHSHKGDNTQRPNELEESSRRSHLGELDIAAATSTSRDANVATAGMGSTGQDIASGSPRASAGQSTNTTRSNTPGAPGNRDQELPTLRSTQPKTLRVVATPKMETPPPMSATTSASAPSPVVRPPSRKTSLASINQPVTPASELISDNASMTSTSMSRANSPPPSKVGSAPLRQTTKSQQKKQRKEAKKEVEKKEQGDVVVNAPLEDIDIAPIVGRKKKQKGKALGAAIAGDMAAIGVGGPTSPLVKETNDVVGNTRVVKADTAINEKDAANEEEKKSVEEVAAKDTTPVAIKPILSAQSIIHDLIRNGEFEPDRHDLLKPVSGVSQRMDVSSADFVDLHRKLSLSTDDQIALGEGHPVRIPLTTPKADGSTHTSRLLVTPGGLTLRGLTPVQEARFLELEERINDCRGPTRFHPARHGGENGFSMVGGRVVQSGPGAMAAAASAIGGRDATAAAADCAANKMRVDEALAYINQFVLPALPSREVSGTGARGKNDSSTSAAASDPNRTRYVMPVSTEGFGADVAGVMHFMASGMDSNGAAEKPGSSSSVSARSGLPSVPLLSVEEAESAMLAAKRETEGLEKRLNALLKKNRRLVLQGSGH